MRVNLPAERKKIMYRSKAKKLTEQESNSDRVAASYLAKRRKQDLPEINLGKLINKLFDAGLIFADDTTLILMIKYLDDIKVDAEYLQEIIGEEAYDVLQKEKRK